MAVESVVAVIAALVIILTGVAAAIAGINRLMSYPIPKPAEQERRLQALVSNAMGLSSEVFASIVELMRQNQAEQKKSSNSNDQQDNGGDQQDNGDDEDKDVLASVAEIIKAIASLLAAQYGGAAFLCLFALGAWWIGLELIRVVIQ